MTQSQSTLIGLHSEWVGESQMRVRVRRIEDEHGNPVKLMCDVTELSPGRTSALRSFQIARRFSVYNGGTSAPSQVTDLQTDRKSIRLKDGAEVKTKVRLMCWAFDMKVDK